MARPLPEAATIDERVSTTPQLNTSVLLSLSHDARRKTPDRIMSTLSAISPALNKYRVGFAYTWHVREHNIIAADV
jgi:hypothetical protein